MNINVGKSISELLFEQPTVILPGLGGFTSTPISATVDYVQGVVTPPAKKLGFNSNLVINDGILVSHIQKRHSVTAQQAKEAVDAYAAELKAALDRREIIEVPEVGRIYRDYEKQLKFMPEGTNFEAEAFGLPGVKFNPVVRAKEPSSTAAPAASVAAAAAGKKTAVQGEKTQPVPPKKGATTVPPKSTAKTIASIDGISKLWPVLLGLVILLLACTIYFTTCTGDGQAIADTDRVNVPPITTDGDNAPTDETATAPADAAGNMEEEPPRTIPDEDSTPPPAAEEPAPPVTVGQGTSFIVVHSFGVKSNARKFENRLVRHGHRAQAKRHDGLIRVGVLFDHETQSELDEMVKKLGKKYGSTPKVVDY